MLIVSVFFSAVERITSLFPEELPIIVLQEGNNSLQALRLGEDEDSLYVVLPFARYGKATVWDFPLIRFY